MKSGNNQVHIELVDTSSLQSVRECAARLRKRITKLDVLINNAGILFI
jgi:short-subunit dehydrogenase involved in D-alanine esterification of teichoic acids